MKETNTIKKSFIASSLTTSAGIFITKLIGFYYKSVVRVFRLL